MRRGEGSKRAPEFVEFGKKGLRPILLARRFLLFEIVDAADEALEIEAEPPDFPPEACEFHQPALNRLVADEDDRTDRRCKCQRASRKPGLDSAEILIGRGARRRSHDEDERA
jgi:hypothetical protein